RYLAGIELFNRGEYFEAHEVWEDLWHETAGPDRRYVQGLIQAAVAVYHAGNGNARGARRLFHSGRRYMAGFPLPPPGPDGGPAVHFGPADNGGLRAAPPRPGCGRFLGRGRARLGRLPSGPAGRGRPGPGGTPADHHVDLKRTSDGDSWRER